MSRTALEAYTVGNDRIIRELKVEGRTWLSSIENLADTGAVGYAAWWQSFLRGGTVVFDDRSEEHTSELQSQR